MAYTTLQYITDAFGLDELVQLTDRAATGTVDAVVIGAAITKAGGEIDGYLAARYTIPLVTVPDLLLGVANDMARYHLYTDAVPEVVKDRYANAVRILTAISAGKISLGLPSASAPAAAGAVEMAGGGRVFGRDQVF